MDGPRHHRPLVPRRRNASETALEKLLDGYRARRGAHRAAGIDMDSLFSLLTDPVRHERPEFLLDRAEPDHPGYSADAGPARPTGRKELSAAG
ncbi:hypothetical protein C9F11_40845 [Streptomyces sp. YIM 121038]|uniref:hypothetical protein n=1 Tax=Streptomyces sp. YIM 121038 TaxID=2136401 RepID=UPI001110D249|nr:hypothetical protein [Streptomyces sp. YIM 121038]QCX81749.1 hypothetical protein C9F11_40845 [Streptomyces sp. YIM 121038]